jgi:YspA, cpYpsA-related SLOG family
VTTIFVVTGSREPSRRWCDLIPQCLDRQHKATPADELWHGACRGTDVICEEWAESCGIKPVPFPADWDALGNAAGPIRNQKMVDAAKARALSGDRVIFIQFPGYVGTANCAKHATAAGLCRRVWSVDRYGSVRERGYPQTFKPEAADA